MEHLNRHMQSSIKTKWLRVSVDGSEEVFAEFRPHASEYLFLIK